MAKAKSARRVAAEKVMAAHAGLPNKELAELATKAAGVEVSPQDIANWKGPSGKSKPKAASVGKSDPAAFVTQLSRVVAELGSIAKLEKRLAEITKAEEAVKAAQAALDAKRAELMEIVG